MNSTESGALKARPYNTNLPNVGAWLVHARSGVLPEDGPIF